MNTPPVSRREIIQYVSALLGGALFTGGTGLLAAAETRERHIGPTVGEFTADDIAFLDEIAETILPATATPGAKAAQTGAFMALMVTDCYRARDRRVFRDGMGTVDDTMKASHQVPFMAATPAQRLALLTRLDADQKRVMDAREHAASDEPAHFFRMMKELALLGYFTSEIGCTQAMRYVESPGRFDPCVPYKTGEPAWAAHA
jgi:hypothetical protein